MPEQLGVVLLFLVLVLINLIGGFIKRRTQKSGGTAGDDEMETRVPVPPRVPPRVVVAPPRIEAPAPVPVPRPPRVAPVRRRGRFDLGQPGDLRRAVVLMTVFGPCRALEDERRGG